MSWDEATIRRAWEKAIIVPGIDPGVWRKDQCGAWIGRSFYGNRESQFGWAIFMEKPDPNHHADALSLVMPLQWENAASREAGQLKCVVTSVDFVNEGRNIRFV